MNPTWQYWSRIGAAILFLIATMIAVGEILRGADSIVPMFVIAFCMGSIPVLVTSAYDFYPDYSDLRRLKTFQKKRERKRKLEKKQDEYIRRFLLPVCCLDYPKTSLDIASDPIVIQRWAQGTVS